MQLFNHLNSWLIVEVFVVDASEEIESCGSIPHGKVDPALKPADLQTCERTAAIFRALGDVNRMRLLSLIAQREMCVTDLTETLQDNLPAISQRLKLLRSERLVRARRQGKHIFYSLSDDHIASLIANGLAHGEEPDEDLK